jgi:hypothetical protein
MAIPVPNKVWVFKHAGFWDMIAALAALTTSLGEAIQEKKATWSVVGIAAIGILLICKSVAAFNAKRKEQSRHELEGCLHTLHAILTGGDEAASVRLTIHVPINDSQLQQALNYVGDPADKKTEGRKFSCKSGVIGKAFIQQQPFAFKRTGSLEEYIKELKSEYNFMESEVKQLNTQRLSGLAVPIPMEQEKPVEGILYLDSKDAEFFTEHRVNLVVTAAAGIATYVAKRYRK